ncbi:MAG: hypothetical protein AAF525_09195 [Pseudomonadota bacterium]
MSQSLSDPDHRCQSQTLFEIENPGDRGRISFLELFDRYYQFYWVSSPCIPLHYKRSPMSAPRSLFAVRIYDHVLELRPERLDNVARVLRRGGEALFDAPRDRLFEFFIDVTKTSDTVLIKSLKELRNASKCGARWRRCTPGAFQINDRQYRKYESRFVEPSVSVDPGGGWIVEYTALSIPYRTQSGVLTHWRIRIDENYNVNTASEVLSKRVFSQYRRWRH